jgi:RNA polymerase sigma-70 factor (ECF subfamily)
VLVVNPFAQSVQHTLGGRSTTVGIRGAERAVFGLASPGKPLARQLLESTRVNMQAKTVEQDRSFESLVRPHLHELFVRALRFERTPVDARDLVQDTLERGLRHFQQFRPGTNVRVWLFTIMFHIFIDRCRRRTHEQLMEPVEAEEVPAPEPEPGNAWEDINDVQLRDALSRLESPFREIVELHCESRCSYKEISERLQIPLGTVGTRLLRARRKLRTLLTEPPAPVMARAS